MANERDTFISSGLRLESAAPPAGTPGRPDGLRAGLRSPATKKEEAAPAAATNDRPGLVTIVGIYEFCRAAIVGTVFAMFLMNPDAHLASRTFWQVFFVVSNGSLRVSYFTPISFCYGLAIGLALFFRVDWGRRILIATSAWTVFRLVRFLAVYSTLSASMSSNPAATDGLEFLKTCVYMLVAVNGIIGLCMAFGPGVTEWFHKRA
ncbi:MAG TPA: hypothetical protein VKT75_13620 [Acidobacteriaceae bacterium]|nr:hypothetical protein [Acidobacteriaceae bacterium]